MSLDSHLEELDARFLEEAAAAAKKRAPPTPAPPATGLDVAREPPPPPARPAPDFPREPLLPAARPIRDEERRPAKAEQEAEAKVKAAAQNLFAAKQPEKAEGKRGFAIAIGLFTVLSVTAIGAYFWWQLQPKSALLVRAPSAPLPQPKPIAPATPIAPAAAPPPATAAVAAAEAKPPTPPAEAGRQASASQEDAEPDPAPASARRAARRTPPAAAAATAPDERGPIRVTREPLRVDPAITRGFAALGRGEYNLARLEYERARKADPRNKDVLHGLAAIALRQGQPEQAEMLYRQIVEADPQDSVAIAALLNLRGSSDPGPTESRLKSLAAAQPELAAPHFSLGNLYARQNRWSDAQQAYFRAHNAEPENPDILYNLAVSLEHLRQNKLAAQYYGQALAAAETHPAGFDRAQAASRIQKLQR